IPSTMVSVRTYNYSIVFAVALGSFTYGFTSAVIGPVFGIPAFFERFGLSYDGSASIIGGANGAFAGGGCVGCILLPWLADRFGRVRAIQVICTIAAIGAVVQAASVHIAMFIVGRAVGGIAAGAVNTIIPIYQSEVSPGMERGRMVGIHGFILVSGYACAAWSGLGCYFATNQQMSWRLLCALQAVAPILLVAVSPWLPESPRWLVLADRKEEALNVLIKLHGTEHGIAQDECSQIYSQIELEKRGDNRIITIFTKPSTRRRFFTAMFVQFIGQSTGILVTSNYQILLWNNLGVTGWRPLLLFGIYASWATFLNWTATRTIDRFGRVRLLTIGIAGGVAMMACFTAMCAVYSGTPNKVGNTFGILFLYLYVTFYASCFDATSYVYSSEIFPTHLRAEGVAAAIFSLFACTLLYTQVAATAFAEVGWKYYLVFVIVPACGLPILARFPETKGCTLEEIAILFGDEVAPEVMHLPAEDDHEKSVTVQRL
ncbi:uncharacterized protein MYCFIDRAFT_97608, partial [Pseudocercospora fijiensis CIRAD86]